MNWNRKFSIRIEFSFGQLIAGFAGMLLLTYVCWEAYWYKKVGLYFIKWHTHIVFTAVFFGIPILLFLLIARFLSKPELFQKLLVAAGAIWSTLILAEILFIITGSNKTYIEERSGFYQPLYGYVPDNVYNLYHKSSAATYKAPEYEYTIEHNSLAFAGPEWDTVKNPRALRIITLGDSFTEGDGAPQDSCYPVLLQKILDADTIRTYEVLNAGVCGSDPVFGFKNLNERLMAFSPDIVIQTVSTNDALFDFLIRGGFERFTDDGKVRFKQAPKWEFTYAISYVLRVFFRAFGYDASSPSEGMSSSEIEAQSNKILNEVAQKFDSLSNASGIKVIFVLLPMKSELQEGKYDLNFSFFEKRISESKGLTLFDLMPCYQRYAKMSGQELSDFYWKIDGHHNSRGYKMMAECISDEVRRISSNAENKQEEELLKIQ